jgi:hypothetical protein
MEARNQREMVIYHLSAQKVNFFQGKGEKGIHFHPNKMEASKQMEMVSFHLSIKKMIFFKKR